MRVATVSIPLAVHPRKVAQELREVFVSLGWTVVPADSGFIMAHRPMNVWSWSDRIVARVFPQGNTSLVVLNSRPRFQLFNWGQDDRNVQLVIDRLFTRMGRQQANA